MKSRTLFSILFLAMLLIGCGGDSTTTDNNASSPGQDAATSSTSQSASPSTDGEAITLRYKFQKGQRRDYLQKNVLVNNIISLNQKTETNMDFYSHLTVDQVAPDGTASVTWITDRVVFKVQGPGGTIRYDSADGEEPDHPQWMLIKPQIEAHLYIQAILQVNPTGTITDCQLTKELTERVKKNPTLAVLLSPSRIKSSAEAFFLPLPDQPIKPNEKWTTTSNFNIGSFKVDSQTTRTYQGKEKRDDQDIARFDGSLKITTKFGPDAPFKKMQYKDGAATSELFDVNLGWLTEGKTNAIIEMESEQMGVPIVAEITQESIRRLLPAKSPNPASP